MFQKTNQEMYSLKAYILFSSLGLKLHELIHFFVHTPWNTFETVMFPLQHVDGFYGTGMGRVAGDHVTTLLYGTLESTTSSRSLVNMLCCFTKCLAWWSADWKIDIWNWLEGGSSRFYNGTLKCPQISVSTSEGLKSYLKSSGCHFPLISNHAQLIWEFHAAGQLTNSAEPGTGIELAELCQHRNRFTWFYHFVKLLELLLKVRKVTVSSDYSRMWQNLWSVAENLDWSLQRPLLCWSMLASVSK